MERDDRSMTNNGGIVRKESPGTEVRVTFIFQDIDDAGARVAINQIFAMGTNVYDASWRDDRAPILLRYQIDEINAVLLREEVNVASIPPDASLTEEQWNDPEELLMFGDFTGWFREDGEGRTFVEYEDPWQNR